MDGGKKTYRWRCRTPCCGQDSKETFKRRLHSVSFFLIFVPFRCEGSVFKCERLAKIPDHILYIVLAKAASKEEEPKQFGVPKKKAVFFLIKGLLFSRVPQIFFVPSYFEAALPLIKNAS